LLSFNYFLEFIPYQLLLWGNVVSHLGCSETAMSESVAFQDVVNSEYVRKTFSYWSASKHDCACTPFCWQLKCSNMENKPVFFLPRANSRLQRHGRGYLCYFASVPWMRTGCFLYMPRDCLSWGFWHLITPTGSSRAVTSSFKDLKYQYTNRIKTAVVPDCTNTC